ncbi:NYN domain-containing protein [Sulfurimonas sp.]|uniref:NYN domain-containing protein n=1 Tax=Sulfurimonas sp. TaxID=2022749 RepID=UPI002B490B8C|nr:NYN domain-containing protein [Sulfurimonas sp.]
MSTNKKIALFIDCENISHKHIEVIIEELASYGEVNIRKAYGDWKNPSLNGWNDKLFDYSLEPIHQPPYTTTKNASDIKMTVDIMKVLCQNNSINYVALATSDSDFTPLITEIKSQGIQVIGFGEEKTSNVLQKACSEFIEVGVKIESNNIEKNKKLINILLNAVRQKKGDDDFAYVAEVGTYLKNQNSSHANKYGFKTWGEIFKNLSSVFEINMLEKNGKRSIMVVKIK